MEAIPTADLLPLLLLLAPGFLTLLLLDQYTGRKIAKDSFDKTLTSLIFSAVIAILFAGIHGTTNLSAILEAVATRPPLVLVDFLSLSLLTAIGVAVVVEADPVSRLMRYILHSRGVIVPDTRPLWDRFMDRHHARYAMVTCKDGAIYQGVISGYSTEEEESALRLANARPVAYDQEGTAQAGEPVEEILLRSDDIVRVEVTGGGTVTIGQPSGKPTASHFIILGLIVLLVTLWLTLRWKSVI